MPFWAALPRILYINNNYSIAYGSHEASARALFANQTSELAGIYGKFSSTRGKVTRVLKICRNTTCEKCLKEMPLLGLWGRWKTEKKKKRKIFQFSKVCYKACPGLDKKESAYL